MKNKQRKIVSALIFNGDRDGILIPRRSLTQEEVEVVEAFLKPPNHFFETDSSDNLEVIEDIEKFEENNRLNF